MHHWFCFQDISEWPDEPEEDEDEAGRQAELDAEVEDMFELEGVFSNCGSWSFSARYGSSLGSGLPCMLLLRCGGLTPDAVTVRHSCGKNHLGGAARSRSDTTALHLMQQRAP